MFSDHRSRMPLITALTVSTVALLLVLGASLALANRLSLPVSQVATPVQLAGEGDYTDEGLCDVSVEWIDDYAGVEHDVSFNDESCDGLYYSLRNSGWAPVNPSAHNFNYGNGYASVWDFRRYDLVPWLEGEDYYIDTTDIAMACVIGANGDAWFNLDPENYLTAYQAYQSYGTWDLEWLAFDTSSLLNDIVVNDWAATMYGLHLFLSFRTPMSLGYIGDGTQWANYMQGSGACIFPHKITQAWFHTIDDLQPAEVCARVLAEREDNFNDYLWGMGYVSDDFPVDEYYSYLDHCSTGSAFKSLLSNNDQPEVLAMPIVQVIDRVVDEGYVMNTIAPAFDMQAADPCFSNETFSVYEISEGMTYTLQVDQVTGSFMYQNLSTLWTKPVITPTLPSADIADVIINNWFRNTPAKNLPGASYRNAGSEYMTEDIVGMNPKSVQIGDTQDQLLTDLPIDVSMTYPRVISVTARTTTGVQAVDFPILGPGGRMKVYLGDQGEIIGVQGGSRDVQVTAGMVEILDAKAVWSMFVENPQLAIGEVSLPADTITHTVPTLGYYEMPYIVPQDEFIPVWEFRGWFYWEGDLVGGDIPIYLPAAAEYMPPQVTILNPSDGSIFWAGEPISLEGLITGGTPHYTIQWSSGKQGYLGNTIDLITTLPSIIRQGTVYYDQIALTVIDANGLAGSDSISVMIKPVFWMPFISK